MWTGDDADGDGLTYMVQYSRDGGLTWEALATELRETAYELDLSVLAGAGAARVRVIASDGVNTAQDESDGTFVVERKAPEVILLSPDDGLTIEPGTSVVLRGLATDVEDGPIEGESLTWTSDRDGELGAGGEVVATLSPGAHIVTLAARDADGNVATVSARVVVTTLGQRLYVPHLVQQRMGEAPPDG
jgi:hypothetical protein